MENFRKFYNIDSHSHISKDANGEVHVTTPSKTVCLKYSSKALDIISSYDVILKDRGLGSAVLRKYRPSIKFFHGYIGDVLSVKRLASGDWFIGCRNERQQKHLLSLESVHGVLVSSRVPVPTTIGVVFDLPDPSVLQSVSDVRYYKSLSICRNGRHQIMTKVTFNLPSLPEHLSLGYSSFKVYPYTPSIQRCTRCQRLNHTLKQCKAKFEVCSRCGGKHSRHDCISRTMKCVNCGGSHSSAYHDCPRKQLLRNAFRLKASTYMSLREAVSRIQARSISSLSQSVDRRSYSQVVQESPSVQRNIPSMIDAGVQSLIPSTPAQPKCDAATQLSAASVMDTFQSQNKGPCFREFLIKVFIPFSIALSSSTRIRDAASLFYETTFGEVPTMSDYDDHVLANLQRDFSRRWLPSTFTTHGWKHLLPCHLPCASGVWCPNYTSASRVIPVSGGSHLGISHSATSVSAQVSNPTNIQGLIQLLLADG